MDPKHVALLLVLMLPLVGGGTALADTLKVAAASSTQEALQEISSRFAKETGHQVRFTFGASGKLFTQISHGAPFAVYFSADDEYPTKLHAMGLSEAPRRYATGRVVLWTLKSSPLDVEQGLSILRHARISRIAIPNPKVAPYGRAAEEAMCAGKVRDSIGAKLVLGENASQAAQFVESGSAEIGILPLALAVSPKLAPRGKYGLIPAKLHEPIDADAVVIKQADGGALARQFLAYCLSAKVQPIWRRCGLNLDK